MSELQCNLSSSQKPKRVLLYEYGERGHRPAILQYLVDSLPLLGWESFVVTDRQFSSLSGSDIDQLESIAHANHCCLIHILTIDGVARRWIRPRIGRKGPYIPIVGSYYLYNNLYGWRGAFWQWVFLCGYLDMVLISDPFIRRRFLMPFITDRICYVPDVWSSRDFKAMGKLEARATLNLKPDLVIVLVFGELSERKGLNRILSALKSVNNPSVMVLFAGRTDEQARKLFVANENERSLAGRYILIDRHIKESEVSSFFYACDAVLSDYPKTFKVSSGAFTRALASGSIPIVPDHGVLAEWIRENRYGLTYTSESPSALAEVLDFLPTAVANKSILFNTINCRNESRIREVGVYAKRVSSCYDSFKDNKSREVH